jgi:hypothetical protein
LRSVARLRIANNSGLYSVAALEELSFARTVQIVGNPALRALHGLEGLERLDHLELSGNGLHTTDGVEGIREVGELVIAKNQRLISLSGFQGLTHVGSLALTGNPRICAKLGLFPRLAEVAGRVSVIKNFGLSSAEVADLRARVKPSVESAVVAIGPSAAR